MRTRAVLAVLGCAVGALTAATISSAPTGAQACHSSYDPCLPIVSDVDCEGGGGDGPVFTGQVRVTGPDEYELDDDGNGIGCEPTAR